MAGNPDLLGSQTEAQLVSLHHVDRLDRPALLRQVEGPGAPRNIALERDRLVLGRSPETDIQVVSASLSRTHLLLQRCYGGFAATDLDSANGLYLNGVQVHAVELRDGDLLQVGDAVFEYVEGR